LTNGPPKGEASTCTINALALGLYSGDNLQYGRSDRVPGSVSVPALDLMDATSLAINTPNTVAEPFTAAGAASSKPILLYCRGGIAATLDALLLHRLGYRDIIVRGASACEWPIDGTLSIEPR
jgi:thiosulfate/3-mercaptopyruvate sulfurtransferase